MMNIKKKMGMREGDLYMYKLMNRIGGRGREEMKKCR